MHVISPEIQRSPRLRFLFCHLLADLWHRRRACHRPISDLDRASRLRVIAGDTDLGTPRVIFEFSVLLLRAFRLPVTSSTQSWKVSCSTDTQEKHKASLSRPLCHLSSLLHLTLLASGLERPVPRQRARRRRARRSAGSGGLEGSWRAKAAESRGDCIVGIARQGVAGTMVPLVGGCGHRAGGQRLSSLFPLRFAASRKGAKKGTVV